MKKILSIIALIALIPAIAWATPVSWNKVGTFEYPLYPNDTIGIGTTTPGYKFTLVGDQSNSGNLFLGANVVAPKMSAFGTGVHMVQFATSAADIVGQVLTNDSASPLAGTLINFSNNLSTKTGIGFTQRNAANIVFSGGNFNGALVGANSLPPNSLTMFTNDGSLIFGVATGSPLAFMDWYVGSTTFFDGMPDMRMNTSGYLSIGAGTSTAKGRIYVVDKALGAVASSTSGITVDNPTLAAAGAQQFSPTITQCGNGWKTTATAGSQPVCYQQYVAPVQGTTNPTGNWVFGSSINNAAYTNLMTLSTAGLLTLPGAGGLTSVGNLRSDGDIFTTGAGDDFWLGNGTQGSALFRAYANGGLIIASSSSIGTTSAPLARLHIVGQAGNFMPMLIASSSGESYFEIEADGSIGIGTSSPVSLLAVNGTTTASCFLVSGTTSCLTAGGGSGSGTVSSSTMGAVAFYPFDGATTTGSSTLLSISTSTGQLSLNTYNSGASFNITSRGTGIATLNFQNSTAGAGAGAGIQLSSDACTSYLFQPSSAFTTFGFNPSRLYFLNQTCSGGIGFASQGVERMTMLDDGSFGIGTTTPSKPLHVYGNTSGGIMKIERFNAATNAPLGTQIIKALSTGDMVDGFGVSQLFALQDNAGVENNVADITAVRQGADSTGALWLRPYTSGAAAWPGLILHGGTYTSSIGTTSIGATLWVSGTTSDPTMDLFRVSSSSNAAVLNILANGNVGIATNTPAARLSIVGAANASNIVEIASSTGTSSLFTINNKGYVGVGTSSQSSSQVTLQTQIGDNNPQLTIWHGTSTRMFQRLTENSATYSFSISAPAATLPSSTFLYNNPASYQISNPTYASTTPAAYFSNGGSGDRRSALFFNSNPGENSTAATIMSFGAVDGFGSARYNHLRSNESGTFSISNGSTNPNNLGTQRFTLDTDGNIGIGSSSPASKFGITGNSVQPTRAVFIVASSSNAVNFTVLANGNVGVGTTTPVWNFAASGTAAFVNLATNSTGAVAACLQTNGQFTKSPNLDCSTSDERLKYDIEPLDLGLETLREFKPIQYFYKGTDEPSISASTAQIAFKADRRFAVLYTEGEKIGTPAGINHQAVEGLVVNSILELDEKVSAIEKYGSSAKRSVEENWQWAAIGLLAVGFLRQQVQIKRLKSK